MVEITKPCPTCGMQVEETNTPSITAHPVGGNLVWADRSWMCPLCDTLINAVDGQTQVFCMTGPATEGRL